jgi:hypothetical protein
MALPSIFLEPLCVSSSNLLLGPAMSLSIPNILMGAHWGSLKGRLKRVDPPLAALDKSCVHLKEGRPLLQDGARAALVDRL